jgi:hypothetical protein
MQEEENKEKGLETHTIAFMISVAGFFDVLQWAMAFLFMDWLVSIFAYLTFFVWLKIHGISFMKPKRLLAGGTSMLFEIIPFVAALPALTAAVAIITLDTKLKKVLPLPTGGSKKVA